MFLATEETVQDIVIIRTHLPIQTTRLNTHFTENLYEIDS